MSTRAELEGEIADEIDDTTGEYGQQITRAILAAQRYCERKNYYFNENRSVGFLTVDGQSEYESQLIPTTVRLQAAWIDNAGQRSELIRVTPQEIESLLDSSASRGEPYMWTYFNQKVRLYPIPGPTIYTIRFQAGPIRFDPLIEGTSTNDWLVEAWDLLKARAKYILQKDVLKNPDLAMEALNDFNDQDAALCAETASRSGTGYVKATCF